MTVSLLGYSLWCVFRRAGLSTGNALLCFLLLSSDCRLFTGTEVPCIGFYKGFLRRRNIFMGLW
jgi:hypothetical protein